MNRQYLFWSIGLFFVLFFARFPQVNAEVSRIKYLPYKAAPKPQILGTSTGMGDFPQPPLRMMGSYGYEIDDFTAHGDYAYAIEGNRIRILSYADPSNIIIINELFHVRPFYRIQISADGTRLFALAGGYFYGQQNDELLLYDVSDPANPRFLSNLRAPIQEMHRYRNRLYITTHNLETHEELLQVYSWDDDAFTLLGQTLYGGWGKFLFDGDILVIAGYSSTNGHENIWLLDISNDSAPEFKRAIQTIGGVAIPINGYLYVSNGDGQSNGGYVDIWDVRDLDTPTIIQTLPNTYVYPTARRGNLIIHGGYRFYDVSNPTELRVVGDVEGYYFSDKIIWNDANDFYTLQHTFNNNVPSLDRIKLTDTFEVIPQGNYTPPWQYAAVAVTDRYLYLFGTTQAGVDIHDMQVAGEPRWVATVLKDEFTWPPTRDYFIVAHHLYLLRSGTIIVLDISNPLAPFVVNNVPLPSGDYWYLESVQNGYLYALRHTSNQIFALRLSDLVGQSIELADAGQCSGLDTEGTTLVLTCDTLRVYDISTPTAPTLLGVLSTPLSLLEPTLALPYLFVTTETQLAIYDVSNAAAPQYVTSVGEPYPAVTEDGVPSLENVGGYICPELVAIEPGYYLRQCYVPQSVSYPQLKGITDIVDLRIPTTPRRSESTYAPAARGVVQGDTLVIAGERLSLSQIRLFLEQVIFMPLVHTGD